MLTTKTLFVFTIFFLFYAAVSAIPVPGQISIGRLLPTGRVPANIILKSRIINEFVVAHNAVRSLIGHPPLTWNNKVAWHAEQWAKKRVNDCKLIHSMGPYGENLFWGGGATYWSPTIVVNSWAAEKVFYDPTSNSCAKGQKCGHYTQIVWKSTRSLGCARVRCNDNKGTFVICNYDPPGNYVNEHPYRQLRDEEEKLNTTIQEKPAVVVPVEEPDL